QRPVVVVLHEEPVLRGKADLDRVPFDVADGPSHIIRVVEEYFPALPRRPGWMVPPRLDQFLSTDPNEVFDHLLGAVPVLPDQDVNVVRHDCAGVTGGALTLDHFAKRFRDDRT